MAQKTTGRPPKAPVRRAPGRPSAVAGSDLSHASIVLAAYELSRSIPLQDISIVLVSRTLNVTPALIHYYVGNRDLLTSGVMNRFYQDIAERWPEPTEDWESDLIAVSTALYLHFVARAGVAAYCVVHNRFRIFQLLEKGETDFGLDVLERFTAIVKRAGCDRRRTGVYAHLLFEFILTSAHGAVSRRSPGEYRDFLMKKVSRLERSDFPAISFVRDTLAELDSTAAFEEGRRLFLSGLRSAPAHAEAQQTRRRSK